ncbi:MAG TPA: potassium transporter TrkG [Micromonosporaceae bacterium]
MTMTVSSQAGAARRFWQHPVRIVAAGLVAAIAIGTLLLMLPAARAGPDRSDFFTALFTATSAISTTGLAITDTDTYWSTFGQVIITLLTQVGGYGIITGAMLTLLLVSHRLGLRGRLVLTAESKLRLDIGNTRALLVWTATAMLVCEAVIAAILTLRFWTSYEDPLGRAAWHGVFHAVQAFNNGGFALFTAGPDRLIGDVWVSLPLTLGVIVGSLGFPVLFELLHRHRPRQWSIQARLTVWGTLILLAAGLLATLYFERDNPATLRPLDPGRRLLVSFVLGAIPRSGGFYAVDFGELHEESLAVTTILMFIGGGSASTAGGIKVTTFFLLGYVIWAELRGEPDVVIGRRRIASVTQRQALTVALLSVALVIAATLILTRETSGVPLNHLLFEVVSAFSTAGLSLGIAPTLSLPGQVVLMILMFVGRLGTIVAASALAVNTRHRHYRYPEERPIVG